MQKIVVANMKMNLLNSRERDNYLAQIDRELKGKKMKDTEMVLCPPFVHLEAFKKWSGKKIKLGAQNVFAENKGSYTGEISPIMLKNFGCEYVILGHSERRRYIGENDEEINLKVTAALKNGLKPILCVGENKNQEMDKVVLGQLEQCLNGVSRGKIENVVICYEPVWAISSNKPDHLPTTNEIMGAKLLIKKFLVKKFGARVAEKVRIIYGGSVADNNAKETCVDSEMLGALVGRDSLTPHKFVKIVEIINE